MPQPSKGNGKNETASEYETEIRAEWHRIMFLKDPTQRRTAFSTFFAKIYSIMWAHGEEEGKRLALKFMEQKNSITSNNIDFDQTEVANRIGWHLNDNRYDIHVPATPGNLKQAYATFENIQDKNINETLIDLISNMLAWLEGKGILNYNRKTDADHFKQLLNDGNSDDDDDDDWDDDDEDD